MQELLSNELLSKNNLFGSIGGNTIKSIQRGVSTISNGQVQVITTIANVDLSKAIIIAGYYSGGHTDNQIATKVHFYSSNQIICQRSAPDSSGTCTIYWQVIEFNNVKSLQSGTSAISSSPVTISTIDVNKSFIVATKSTASNISGNANNMGFGVEIVNATQIAFHSNASNDIFEWFVTEFN